jgi:2-polyprenyl-3-methyl-5-hydroxy-6-metoxy-1,4-benzoquinol methylase
MLPGNVERFGVEPAVEASNKVDASGVSIISFEDLQSPAFTNSFDAVTAIDIVEHTQELIRLREYFATALRPGGILVLLTGNFESRPAKFLGRYWYYLHYSEHVSFFSARSMQSWLAPSFHSIDIVGSSHHPLTFVENWRPSVKCACCFP